MKIPIETMDFHLETLGKSCERITR